ncbi:MAG TPA: signal peptidase I [Bryobacteraceae bacterium]|jgi:signal peptidase I|nr:signal peptidase I [Bryobacteraceae bacterium]
MKNFANSTRDFITEWALNILILLFGTTTLVQAFIVPTPSMDKTVMVGDHLLVDKLSYAPSDAFSKHLLPYTEPKRGDIIVFRYPMDISQNYVKRCMGLPGDRIKVVDKELWLNGHKLVEPYVQHIFPRIEPYRDNFPAEPYGPVYDRARKMLTDNVVNGEVVVPEESYFAMGDNRDNSLDSRYWGFVPRENIIGKPLVIFWSYDAPTEDWVDYNSNHFIDLAKNFFRKTRWDRTLKLVRGYPVQ